MPARPLRASSRRSTPAALGGKLAATLGTIIDRYMAEDFLTLRHSTQTTNKFLELQL
jgi:hypothetical protein